MSKVIIRQDEQNSRLIYIDVINTSEDSNEVKIEDLRLLKGEKLIFIFNSVEERKSFLNIVQRFIEETSEHLTLSESIDYVCTANNTPFIYKDYLNIIFS